MAFNLLVVLHAPVDWSDISERYVASDRSFELFPITDAELGDALGISIPLKYFNAQSWSSAATFLSDLFVSCQVEVYDMYTGHAIDIATYKPEGLGDG